MLRDFLRFIREMARNFYIVPLSLLVLWYFGRCTFFVSIAFFYIGGFEARSWTMKQLAKPKGEELA